MAVGRNLAYKKSEFFSVKGFINHINIRSGDDDLFIQDAANKGNTAICTSLDSFTISKAPETLNEWFRQKRRHVSTASYYKKRHQFSLGLFYFSKVIFYITSIGLFFFHPWEIMLPIVVGYFTIQYLVIGLWAKKLEETNILYYLPFLEIFLMLFQFAIFITNLVSKPTHWK
jgi:cellulose synthase/poly-beta-1,6-N-acetylglucosamine synthase-like glycosyltransferase